MAKLSIIEQIAALERDAFNLKVIRNGLLAVDPESINVNLSEENVSVGALSLTLAGLSLVKTFQKSNYSKDEILIILGCEIPPNNYPDKG